MKKKALITGISGQDGSYLAELLLSKGYIVHGTIRKISYKKNYNQLWRIQHLLKKLKLHLVSLDSHTDISDLIKSLQPDEVYHLAAQSYIDHLFNDEFSTLNTNINGTHHVLSAIKETSRHSRFYFAGSSEMYGKVKQFPQNENTPFNPMSTYAISKIAGFNLTQYYRDEYNIYASSGILFSHESPRRGLEFVTRKISHGVAAIKANAKKKIVLGNIKSKRDWGHAKDYVKAMWLILQNEKPEDYVVGTGKTHSVEEFLKKSFELINLNYKDYIIIDKNLIRPSEASNIVADYTKAKKNLMWKPEITFDNLILDMVKSDLDLIKKN
tara:strand:- start:1267 stop:2244 length:978 start_codon:yes stop_codon:yes gene_type:complete